MSFDLTNKNIQDTFQNLLQKTGSDGRLYDLQGNPVIDLRISGSLIAEQYVVSSSVTNITTQQLSGSTQFGDSSDDTHLFTGHITASSNISASLTGSFGRVECQTISASSGEFDASTIFLGGESFTRANIQTLKQGRSLKPLRIGKERPDFEAEDGRFDGNITASGDIINTQVVQMTNSSSLINTFNTGSHQTCKYVLQVTSGSHIQSSEMLVMQNSSNVFNTEYAQINSGLNLVNFSSKVNTERGTVELIGSSSFISCSVKFVRTLI